ncbi:hypothetical protein [Companilactobacillus ginsenosidimutans]|uniref:Uncharacterized protein n=1 Tax=Companilactobacillus ginsenosidimutans TaxID=1007676 RepID=A0A0H4R129_9LACO|nr:hypothetical protein [Companilactobacillus ginsenosidimutans]AKP67410.1 hypothetical protein ABM34_07585 [Companilactobacillus ginsenosidimutans]
MSQKEQVLDESSTFARYAKAMNDNMAESSNVLKKLVPLNYKLGKFRDKNYFASRMAKYHNHTFRHRRMAMIEMAIAAIALFYILRLYSIPFLLLFGYILLTSTNIVRIPFIELRDEDKTNEYKTLEQQFQETDDQFDDYYADYSEFQENALITALIIEPGDIGFPTIESQGEYEPIGVSQQLAFYISRFKANIVESMYQAEDLFNNQQQLDEQKQSHSQMINSINDLVASSKQTEQASRVAAAAATAAAASSAATARNTQIIANKPTPVIHTNTTTTRVIHTNN